MSDTTVSRPLVDTRGPRFGAAITAFLLLVNLVLALLTPPLGTNLIERLSHGSVLLALVIFALFLYGALRGVQHHPYGLFFARVVRPRLSRPGETEDAAAPTFAQAIGAFVTGVGLLLALLGVPLALPIALAAAFVAAFLNAAFGLCLGCELYLLLRRAGVIRNA